MQTRTILSVGIALAALAGCNKQPGVDRKNARPKEVASAMAKSGGPAEFIHPGEWVSTSTVEEAVMPGMSPQMAERMKQSMHATSTHKSCITEAEVKKPNAGFFGGDQEGCTYDRFTMANGAMDVKMTCKGGGGGAMSMAIAGKYSAEHYTARMTMTGSGPGPAGQGMTMKANIDAKRVGECSKAEAAEQ